MPNYTWLRGMPHDTVRPSIDHRVNVLYLINQTTQKTWYITHNTKRELYEAEGTNGTSLKVENQNTTNINERKRIYCQQKNY
jgi:hypothetical protein